MTELCGNPNPHSPHTQDRGPFGLRRCPGIAGHTVGGDLAPDDDRSLGERIRSGLVDPQPDGQAPVTGYTKQPPEKVQIVNAIKDVENMVGETLEAVLEMDGIDRRMTALARTNLQQGFMWLVRAVFQPESRL